MRGSSLHTYQPWHLRYVLIRPTYVVLQSTRIAGHDVSIYFKGLLIRARVAWLTCLILVMRKIFLKAGRGAVRNVNKHFFYISNH